MDRTATYAENIRAAWNAATDDQKTRGMVWYQVANELATMVGNGDASKGAGIIAALSPRMQWDRNVNLAKDALAGKPIHAMSGSVRKAEAIMNGADPADVLPMSAKTGNFYLNMAFPNDPNPVTIDCWAYRVASRDWSAAGPRSPRDYRDAADAYRIVATELGIIANRVQAGIWNWARETKH